MARHPHGFTLIELVASVVIMALVAASLAPGMLARWRAGHLGTVVKELEQLDARARLASGRFDRVVVRQDEIGDRILAEGFWGAGTLEVESLEIPPGIDVSVIAERGEVSISASGVSVDYGFRVEQGAAGAEIQINGLSGWAVTEKWSGDG